MTHHELMTGEKAPLSSREFRMWNAFFNWEAREMKRQMEAAKSRR